MLDPLMTLLAAKAKAVGLVAGTALVTTALVGGGTVALTAVSHDKASTSTVTASATADLLSTTAVSATPTVGIVTPSPLPGQHDGDGDLLDDLTLLPLGFACDDSKNHGQNVSSYVHTLPKGPGRGALVSAVAKSDCGKKTAAEAEATASPEAAAVKPVKPAKAQKPAKHKPAKPARSGGHGKPEGKGGPGKG